MKAKLTVNEVFELARRKQVAQSWDSLTWSNWWNVHDAYRGMLLEADNKAITLREFFKEISES